MREDGESAALLLRWYDRMARPLPWRVRPAERAAGKVADPYRVWLSEVMLQQTTVAAVVPYFHAFTERWPDVEALAAAPEAEVMAAWAGLGYYARARNLIACARAVAEAGGPFPETEEGLRALPGIGAYTAAAVAAIAFDRAAAVVDGNVERVMARVFAVEKPLPEAKAELKALAATLTPRERPGDYAQAVMDLGATVCVPRRPACGVCPWIGVCEGRARGIEAELPRRREKAAKPVRRGLAFCAVRGDGAVLLERRPERGLLGGMLGLPGSDWGTGATAMPPVPGAWRLAGAVWHTFTHFHLELAVEAARVESGAPAGAAFHPPEAALRAVPTVMRKALRLGLSALAA